MVSFKRILKDYSEAASLSGLLALWGFVDEHSFMTKAGAVGVAYRLEGADYECLDHSQRAAIAQRFERALRQLDETFRVYQYVIKRHSAPFESKRHANPAVDRILCRRSDYLAMFAALCAAYRPRAAWEPWTTLESRTAALLPGLLLARVDGKSPVEYVTRDADRNAIRAFARTHLLRPVSSLTTLARAWAA